MRTGGQRTFRETRAYVATFVLGQPDMRAVAWEEGNSCSHKAFMLEI